MIQRMSADGTKWAWFSECDAYRYCLGRGWSAARGTMAVIGINPSTADHERPDPTLTRCVGFARDAGYGELLMLNPFAYRHKDVRVLAAIDDPVGPENDAALLRWTAVAECVVWASGPPNKVPPRLRHRLAHVERMLRDSRVKLHALAFCKDGSPAHPLMLPKTCRPLAWP